MPLSCDKLPWARSRKVTASTFGSTCRVPVSVWDSMLGHEVTDEDLARERGIDHACEFNRHVANDEVVRRGVQAFRLVKFVTAADMETGAQARYGLG